MMYCNSDGHRGALFGAAVLGGIALAYGTLIEAGRVLIVDFPWDDKPIPFAADSSK
jgi:hypothetical protein